MTQVDPQPVRTGPSQQYGQSAELERAQEAVPLPDLEPGQLDFQRPTERPDEPITAGLPFGAGPGPEALGRMPTTDRQVDARQIEPYIPALEFMASQPTATPAFRTWVRQARANVTAARIAAGAI